MNLARLRPTRVYRFYRGGALIDRLRGEPEQDGDRPEDWVGSVVAANNPGRSEPEAGLSFAGLGDLISGVVDGLLDALPGPQRHAVSAALYLEDASQVRLTLWPCPVGS